MQGENTTKMYYVVAIKLKDPSKKGTVFVGNDGLTYALSNAVRLKRGKLESDEKAKILMLCWIYGISPTECKISILEFKA